MMAGFDQAPQPHSQPQSQPQPQSHSTAPELQKHHVHHSYVWLGSLRMVFVLLVAIGFSSFSSIVNALSNSRYTMQGDASPLFMLGGLVLVGLIVVVALAAAFQVVAYKHLYYELGSEEFNFYQGILNKKRVHVPYQRIQSVDQRATLIQRLFGVCNVSIDTAGGASNKAVTVPYVQKTQAEELRRELFARKQYAVAVQSGAAPEAARASAGAVAGVVSPSVHEGTNVLDAPAEIWQDVRGVFGGAALDTGKVTYTYGLSNRELIFTGLSNNTAFFVVVIGIIGTVSQLVGQLAPILFGTVEPLVGNVVATSVQMFGGNLIAAGITAFLAVAVVFWIVSAMGACISYGGFRACRRDKRIEVEHGLLQHRFQGVDVDRVQSVVVKQSFIRRLLGYCELSLGKIDAAVEGSENKQKNFNQNGLVIHPFVKMTRVPEILAGIIPEFADVPVESIPVAPVGLRRAIIRRCIIQGSGFWLAVLVALGHITVNATMNPGLPDEATTLFFVNNGALFGYALAVVLLILDGIGAVLWFRGSGFAFNKGFMQVSNGGFARETISFPRKKIQFGYTKTNPFQRNAGTATVNARTAAGIGGTTIRLIDADKIDAQAWLDWLKPRGNVIQ